MKERQLYKINIRLALHLPLCNDLTFLNNVLSVSMCLRRGTYETATYFNQIPVIIYHATYN